MDFEHIFAIWRRKLQQFLTSDRLEDLIFGLIILLVGWFLARTLRSALLRTLPGRFTAHQRAIWGRGIYYLVFLIFIVAALHQMGFKLSVFLGAAGILTVAIGFASQTSASNLISGLFLIGEGAFTIGDWIKIGETEGEVLAIDLLSIKLRTIDNLYIRIPNESIIKTPVTNLTRFPIRRVTLTLSVAYEEDIGKVRQLLMRIADQFPLVLNEPRPQVTLQRFADASFDVLFVVWVARENFVTVRDGLHERIKDAFVAAGITLPMPQTPNLTRS